MTNLKKQTTVALFVKIEKTKSSEERAEIVAILKERGQDVSKWETVETVETVATETVAEEVAETVADAGTDAVTETVTDAEISGDDEATVALRKDVDSLIEIVIEEKRIGVYQEIMKALGGKFDSDFEELLAAATVEQLKEAASFRTLAETKKGDEPKAKKEKVVKEKKEKAPKAEKAPKPKKEKAPKAEGEEGGVNITIEKFADADFALEGTVTFSAGGAEVTGTIKRFYICHVSGKEKARIKGADGKIYFKTSKDLK